MNARDPRARRTPWQPADALAAAHRLEAAADAMRAEQLEHRAAEPEPAPLVDEPPTGLLDLAAIRAALGDDTGDEPVNPAAAAWLAGADPEPAPEPEPEPEAHAHPYFVEGCRECVEFAERVEQLEDDRRRAALAVVTDEGDLEPAPEPAPEPEPAFIPERSSGGVGWVSRHDPRSRQFGVRRQFTGSVPVHDVVLPVPSQPLDQGEEGACVGAAVTQAANVLRLLAGQPAALTMREALAAYGWAQRNDAIPGENYEGTDVNAGMRAGRELGYWPGWSWSFGTRDIAQTVMRRRPVVVGVPWLTGMFATGPGGLVEVAGDDAGAGHCLLVVALKLTGPQGQPGPFFGWLNSYGLGYGDRGIGWIHHADLARLLRGGGEAATPDLPAATS